MQPLPSWTSPSSMSCADAVFSEKKTPVLLFKHNLNKRKQIFTDWVLEDLQHLTETLQEKDVAERSKVVSLTLRHFKIPLSRSSGALVFNLLLMRTQLNRGNSRLSVSLYWNELNLENGKDETEQTDSNSLPSPGYLSVEKDIHEQNWSSPVLWPQLEENMKDPEFLTFLGKCYRVCTTYSILFQHSTLFSHFWDAFPVWWRANSFIFLFLFFCFSPEAWLLCVFQSVLQLKFIL